MKKLTQSDLQDFYNRLKKSGRLQHEEKKGKGLSDRMIRGCHTNCRMALEKAVKMANLMDVKILGLVENYSYIVCPDCGKVIRPYGESKIEELAKAHNTAVLATLPIDPELASLCDKGVIELFEGDYLERAADALEEL